ncbi:MAG: hypothetical protein AAF772_21340, partial [Acidobacteriota bacterium]
APRSQRKAGSILDPDLPPRPTRGRGSILDPDLPPAAARDDAKSERRPYRRIEDDTPPPPPQFLPLLVTLMLLVLIGGYLVDRFIAGGFVRSALQPEAQPPVVAESTNAPVAPDRHRMAFERFERALFAPSSGDFLVISSRIVEASNDLMRNLENAAGSHGDALRTGIFDLARAASEDDLDLARLERLRLQWLGLRQDHVDNATWLQQGPQPVEDGALILAYRQAADDLAALAVEGSRIVEAGGSAEARAQWRDASRAALDQVIGTLPAPPRPGTDARLLLVRDRIDQAIGDLRILLQNGDNVTADGLDSAYQTVDAARRSLDDLAASIQTA